MTQHTIHLSKDVVITDQLDAQSMTKLGLTDQDMAEARKIADSADFSNPLAVSGFGHEVAVHTSSYTDKILSYVRSNDTDVVGNRLNEIVDIARRNSTETFTGPAKGMTRIVRSATKLPLVGPLMHRMGYGVARVSDRFQSASHQIEAIVADISQSQANLSRTNEALEEMFHGVWENHRLLGVHIAAAKMAIPRLQEQGEAITGKEEISPAELQSLADLDASIHNLDKRIGDMRALQTNALQTIPQIRMIQAANVTLSDKFHTIQEVTIPTWKQGYSIRAALTQQRSAVQLADAIDDATNELLSSNAKMLHDNSVKTAQANQRLVIDTSTLQTVQDELYKTVQDVMQIRQQGAADRKKAELQLQQLQDNMRKLVTSQPPVSQNKSLH
jgi:uncharacterized protein YaaN involved in tellurite resistance